MLCNLHRKQSRNDILVYLMPDKVKRKTQVATNKNRQREPEFNTYLDFPLNIIEGSVNFMSLSS